MVFVCLNGYFYILCRLDSGGEASLRATFLATTLGLRRLFSFPTIKQSLFQNSSLSIMNKIIFQSQKQSLNSGCYKKIKSFLPAKKVLVQWDGICFRGNSLTIASFYTVDAYRVNCGSENLIYRTSRIGDSKWMDGGR